MLTYGISDQFAGHGPGYNAHSPAQTAQARTESAAEQVMRLAASPLFQRQGKPGVCLHEGKACLCFDAWDGTGVVFTAL